MPELTVNDINNREDLRFINLSQDAEDIKSSYSEAEEYDSFFVKIGDGDYLEIYGLFGIVPYLYKTLYKILQPYPLANK